MSRKIESATAVDQSAAASAAYIASWLINHDRSDKRCAGRTRAFNDRDLLVRPRLASRGQVISGYRAPVRSVAASGLLWAERIVLFVAGGLCLVIASVLIAWLLAVDWQVLAG